MKGLGAALTLGIALAAPGAAGAQLAELQTGFVLSGGTARGYGPGGGATLGLSAGRLTYVGLRWVYYGGSTVQERAWNVRTRTQTYGLDLAVVIPKGPMELMPGVSLGVLRFAQRTDSAGVNPPTHRAAEFLFSPGLAAEIHVGGAAIIPEVQWSLAGRPDLPFSAPHRGLVASVRCVLVTEIGRIRR